MRTQRRPVTVQSAEDRQARPEGREKHSEKCLTGYPRVSKQNKPESKRSRSLFYCLRTTLIHYQMFQADFFCGSKCHLRSYKPEKILRRGGREEIHERKESLESTKSTLRGRRRIQVARSTDSRRN